MKTRGLTRITAVIMTFIFVLSMFVTSVSAKDIRDTYTDSVSGMFRYVTDTLIEKAKSLLETMRNTVKEETGIEFTEDSVTIDGEEYSLAECSEAEENPEDTDKTVDKVYQLSCIVCEKIAKKLAGKDKEANKKLADFSTNLVNGFNKFLPEISNVTDKDEYVSENFYEGMSEFLTEPAENARWSLGYSQKSILPENIDEKTYYLGGNVKINKEAKNVYDLLDVEVSGVLDDIKVRVIALNDNSGRGTVVYAVVDTVGLYNRDVKVIREKLEDYAKENNIVSINILSSHSHSSIDTQGLWTDTVSNLLYGLFVAFTGIGEIDAGADEKYMADLTDTTAEAVKEACEDMEKGKMYFAACDYDDADNINYYNDISKYSKTKRICYDKDGKSKYVSCNETISRFTFIPDSGTRPTMMVNCAIHPNELGQVFNYISGEYVYYMEEVINEGGYDFIFFLGAEASTDMFETNESDYKHIPENEDEEIEEHKGKINNLKTFGYELGMQALYMTKSEDEVKNDAKATQLSEKYLSCLIKRNDNRYETPEGGLGGDPYYWYEDKPYTSDEEVEPILNVKISEFLFDVTNPMIITMGKLGLADVNVIKDDDGRYYYASEIGYAQFGNKKIMMVPGELSHDLVSGEVSYTAEYSYSHTEYPYPTFAEIAEDEDLMVFGLANDAIGYIIPDNDYLQTFFRFYSNVGVGFNIGDYRLVANHPLWLINGRDNYMELLSMGKNTASTLSEEFQILVDSVK